MRLDAALTTVVWGGGCMRVWTCMRVVGVCSCECVEGGFRMHSYVYASCKNESTALAFVFECMIMGACNVFEDVNTRMCASCLPAGAQALL